MTRKNVIKSEEKLYFHFSDFFFAFLSHESKSKILSSKMYLAGVKLMSKTPALMSLWAGSRCHPFASVGTSLSQFGKKRMPTAERVHF